MKCPYRDLASAARCGAHSAYTDAFSSSVPYLSSACTTRDALWLLARMAHLPRLALKMAATSLRLSSAEIFFTRSRSHSAVMSWMRVKFGFCSAFCSLAQSFCSLRVWLVHAGAVSCFLDTGFLASEPMSFLDFLDLMAAAAGASPTSLDAPSALRFLLSFPGDFAFFLASTLASSNPAASAPPMGLTD